MDKATANLIMREVIDAADAVYARHGLKRSKASSTYDTGMLRVTLTATSTDPALDPKVTDWHRYAESYGLPEDALGREITVTVKGRPTKFVIAGLLPGRSKFTIAVREATTNKDMLLTVSGVKRALGIKVEAWD